jgi:hypothetical protein
VAATHPRRAIKVLSGLRRVRVPTATCAAPTAPPPPWPPCRRPDSKGLKPTAPPSRQPHRRLSRLTAVPTDWSKAVARLRSRRRLCPGKPLRRSVFVLSRPPLTSHPSFCPGHRRDAASPFSTPVRPLRVPFPCAVHCAIELPAQRHRHVRAQELFTTPCAPLGHMAG